MGAMVGDLWRFVIGEAAFDNENPQEQLTISPYTEKQQGVDEPERLQDL